MIPLLLLLLLAASGHAWFGLDPDCERNACFVLLKCDKAEMVLTYVPASPCKGGLKLIAEIDIRSPYRFDFRVFVWDYDVLLVLPNFVSVDGGRGTAHLFADGHTLLNNTEYNEYSDGIITANMSNYRFTLELKDRGYNLITELGRYRMVEYKLQGGDFRYADKPNEIIDSFRERANKMWCNYYDIIDTCAAVGNGQCSMLNLTDPATACDSKLWYHNTTSDSWMWMTKLQCKDGIWRVSALDRTVPVTVELDYDTRTKFYCGQALPQCEHRISTIQLVFIILLGLYSGFLTVVLIFLFVMLYHKMNAMNGRSTYGIMTRMPSAYGRAPPSSGSSSENESGSGKKTTEDKGVMMKVKKEKKKKPAKKAKNASKTKKTKKEQKSSGSASSAEGRSD